MPGDDALTEAIDELYSADPDDFVKRRGVLAGQARQDGDPKAAAAITALRRPTKAAWLINRLVRTDPEVASGLAELARRLRDAQRTLDGAQLRELTQQRRKQIDRAIRQAFNLSGQAESAATLRQEVASTLEAALADPDVAEQLAGGTLVRSAEWSGFGDSTPTLSAVPPLPVAAPKGSTPRGGAAKRGVAERGAAKTTGTAAAVTQHAEPTAVGAEQRRQERVARAEQALAAATEELAAASAAERAQDDTVAQLAEQLADARRRLDEARLNTRRAKAQQREAQRKLDRAGR